MDDPELTLESRRDIYRAIDGAPGVHVRELQRRLDYAKGTVQYHLRWLADHDLVESETDGEYTRYYPARELAPEDKRTLSALRRRYSREVLAHLAADGPLTTTDLAERVGKSQSTVSWHLSRLLDAGVVAKRRDERGRVTLVLENPDETAALLGTVDPSLPDRMVDRFTRLLDRLLAE